MFYTAKLSLTHHMAIITDWNFNKHREVLSDFEGVQNIL